MIQFRQLLVSGVVIFAAPLSVFGQSCVDPDGDGWGWDGTDSCRVVQTDVNCHDGDGDGWGWNGTHSCRVQSSGDQSEDQTQNQDQTNDLVCVDSDGDGWGWNGVDSCRVAQNTDNQGDDNGNTKQDDLSSARFDRHSDLLALHFDHAPDPDDGHAAAAAFVIHDTYSLPVQVVGGTYGVYSASRYVPESESLMRQIWGSQWLDAHNTRPASVEKAKQRWASVMAAGGDVWVAEGGPSDFTAAVVRKLQQQYPQYNTRNRVHVVQHSVWNEDHALREDLNYVRSNTNYIRIEDGNHPNSTADLRQDSSFFVEVARNSVFSRAWNAAFDYLSPSEKLDFSDTVEVLYILDIGTGDISGVDDFGNFFLNR